MGTTSVPKGFAHLHQGASFCQRWTPEEEKACSESSARIRETSSVRSGTIEVVAIK